MIKKSHKTYMKKLKDRLLKNKQMARVTLKVFADYFLQDLNDLPSILIAIEETICTIREEHQTEIKISIKNDLNPGKIPLKELIESCVINHK